MVRDSDGTYWYTFLRVDILADKGIYLGPAPSAYLLEMMWGDRQVSLTVETFLETTTARGSGDEVNRNRLLSGGCNRPPC